MPIQRNRCCVTISPGRDSCASGDCISGRVDYRLESTHRVIMGYWRPPEIKLSEGILSHNSIQRSFLACAEDERRWLVAVTHRRQHSVNGLRVVAELARKQRTLHKTTHASDPALCCLVAYTCSGKQQRGEVPPIGKHQMQWQGSGRDKASYRVGDEQRQKPKQASASTLSHTGCMQAWADIWPGQWRAACMITKQRCRLAAATHVEPVSGERLRVRVRVWVGVWLSVRVLSGARVGASVVAG